MSLEKTKINGIEVKTVATSSIIAEIGDVQAGALILLALRLLQNHPVDMLIFEDGKVRSAGYYLYDYKGNKENETLDETTILATDAPKTKKIYFKVDNYGDYFVGTLLFPSDW